MSDPLVHGETLSRKELEEVCVIVASLRDLKKRGLPVDSCRELRDIAAGGSAYARAVMEAGGMVADHHFAECRRLLGLCVAQGHTTAQYLLGEMHRHGQGGPVDFAEARRLCELAAAQGHDGAQYMLGHMHRHGEGGPVDFAEARRLFGIAAAQG